MTSALLAFHQRRGASVGVAALWDRFFREVDADCSGRVTLEELDAAVRVRLRAEVSRYELRVLWQRMDGDGSGLVSPREFARLMYRVQLSAWPDLSQESEAYQRGRIKKQKI